MNLAQLLELKQIRPVEAVGLRDIHAAEFTKDPSDRTLLWGYTVDRESFHVYLRDGIVHKVVYGYGVAPQNAITAFSRLTELVPSKRLYPEACDYDFCKFLRENGVGLPFTTFDMKREPKQFHGETVA